MEEDAKFQIGIKALITNEKNEILLLKAGPEEVKFTTKEFWDLPGGRIKIGRDIEDTLGREIEEELGISRNQIDILNLFDAVKSNFRASTDENLFLMLIIYRCRLLGDKNFRLSREHSEYKWVDVNEAKRLLSIKFGKSFIDKLDKLK